MSAEKITRAQVAAFLSGLNALTAATGVEICGCGCCGSPFLMKATEKSGRYVVDPMSDEAAELVDRVQLVARDE